MKDVVQTMEPVLMDTAPVHLATVEAFVKHVSSVCCWCNGRSCILESTYVHFCFFFTVLEVCGTAPNRTICYNNGSCVNNTCRCTSEYTGQNCTQNVCELRSYKIL